MFWRTKWPVLRLLIIFIVLVDIIVNLSLGGTNARYTRIFRLVRGVRRSSSVTHMLFFFFFFHPFVCDYYILCAIIDYYRVFFVVERSHNLVNNVKLIYGAAVKVYEVLVMLLMVVLAFSSLGYVIMSYIPNDTYFTSFYNSFVNVFTLMTTVNFPDVMLPSYRYNRAYAIFFVVYLLVSLYLILNLSLALIYSFYKKGAKDAAHKIFKMSKTALIAAFKTVDIAKRGFLDYEQWSRLYARIKPNATESQTKVMYDILDTHGDRVISAIEFMKLDEVLQVKLTRSDYWYKLLLKKFRSLYRPRVSGVARILHSSYVIIVN